MDSLRNLLRIILSFLFLACLFISNSFATVKYESELGYTIEVPKKWDRTVKDKGASLVISSPDKRAEVRLNVYEMEKKKSALEILTGIEKNLKMENSLEEDEIRISGVLLRQFRASEGAQGVYRIRSETGDIIYSVYILLKGNRFFLIFRGVLEEYSDDYAETLDGIVSSIRLSGDDEDYLYEQTPIISGPDDDEEPSDDDTSDDDSSDD